MKTKIIVDSNIITEYLKTGKGVLPVAYEKYTMVITVATLTELLASKTFEDANLKTEVNEFIAKYFSVVEINREIAENAATLLREKRLTLASAYLASSALVNGYPLLTDDKKQFSSIEGIEIVEI